MSYEEIKQNLCAYNPQNPNCLTEDGEPRPKICRCDNCFYGRTNMAEYILEIYDVLFEFISEHDITIGGIDKNCTQEEIDKLKRLVNFK